MNKWKMSVCASVLAICATSAQAETFSIVDEGDYGYSHANYQASKATDGNTAWSSRWAANNGTGNVNLWIDLGEVKSLTDFGVVWGRGHQRTYQFEIRARAGTSGSWTKVYGKTWSNLVDSHGDEEIYDINDIDARFVRVKIFDNSTTSTWANVLEVVPYGNSNNGNLSSSVAPSGNFDLSQWKLTIPESETSYFGSGDSDAAEIKPGRTTSTDTSCSETGVSLDDGFEDNDYFYTSGDGAMTFAVPLADSASTLNSSYARSELRELYDWSPSSTNCNGDGDANWSPAGTHILSGTVKVTDYYDGDPQVVVGQIHAKDSSKALLKLQWDGPTKDVRAIVNADPTDGNPFNLDFGLIPATDEWSYVIKLVDEVMTVSVTYDGTTVTRSVEFGSDGMSSDWNDHVYYFKAGNYAQAPIGSDGEFTVNFYSLNVSHN